jgi:hypothetical protein
MRKRRSSYSGTHGTPTICICPRCGKKYERKIFWTGKGTPKKFCVICAPFAEIYCRETEALYHNRAALSQAVADSGRS